MSNIKKINKIRKFLTEDETKMLMSSNVLSHLELQKFYIGQSPQVNY